MPMMQLLIQELKREYKAIDKILDAGWFSGELSTDEVKAAYQALDSILRKLILSQTSYNGMTDAQEIVRNSELDMKYVTGALSEPEMKEREEWHWTRTTEDTDGH